MKILAFESTAKNASVALTEDEKLLALCHSDGGFTQSELLLPMAQSLLDGCHLSFSDVDAYAVTKGPGSFTGVRIGAATVKGLAFGRNMPVVGISTLDSLALNCEGLRGVIVPVMDARRNEVYTAIFEGKEGKITRLSDDEAISVDALLGKLTAFDAPIYFVGDGYDAVVKQAKATALRVEETPVLLRPECAYSTARLAFRCIQSGEYVTDTELSPTYLRLPQAERERLERLKQQS